MHLWQHNSVWMSCKLCEARYSTFYWPKAVIFWVSPLGKIALNPPKTHQIELSTYMITNQHFSMHYTSDTREFQRTPVHNLMACLSSSLLPVMKHTHTHTCFALKLAIVYHTIILWDRIETRDNNNRRIIQKGCSLLSVGRPALSHAIPWAPMQPHCLHCIFTPLFFTDMS